MPFFGNLVGGFSDRLRESRKEEEEKAAKNSALEMQIFGELANSPDPEIQAVALSGLLNAASPKGKAKGLRGFLGESDTNPAMGEIRRLIGTPVTQTRTVKEGAPPEYLPQAPNPTAQPAALPASSPIQPGAPGVAPTQPTDQAGGPPAAPALADAVGEGAETDLPGALSTKFPTTSKQVTSQRPREIFPSQGQDPMEQARRKAIGAAKAYADLTGDPEAGNAYGIARMEAELAGIEAQAFQREAMGERALRAPAGGTQGRAQLKDILIDGVPTTVAVSPDGQSYEVVGQAVPKAGGAGGAGGGGRITTIAGREYVVRKTGLTPEKLVEAGREAELQQHLEDFDQQQATRPVDQAGSKVTAVAEAKQYVPLEPQVTQKLGLSTGVAPVDMVGVRLNTDEQIKILDAATVLRPTLRQVEGLIPKVFPVSGTLGTNLNLLLQSKQADPDYRELQQALGLMVRNANSVLANDPDRLTDADADRVQKALVSLEAGTFFSEDTRESAQRKLRVLQDQTDRIYARLRKPVLQVEQNYKRRISGGPITPPPPGPPEAPPGPGRKSTYTDPTQVAPAQLYRAQDGRYVKRMPDGTFKARNPQTGQFDQPYP